MKFNLKNIAFFLFGALMLASCGNDYDVADYFDLEELPGYVAFDVNESNNAVLDTMFIDETAGMASFFIECPTGTLSDVNITYDISGNATAGVDYNIANAGSITLETNETDFQNFDRVALDIEILEDAVVDGEKMITITLTGASNAEGSLAVGRGGTDYLKSAVVVIADVD